MHLRLSLGIRSDRQDSGMSYTLVEERAHSKTQVGRRLVMLEVEACIIAPATDRRRLLAHWTIASPLSLSGDVDGRGL